MKKARKHYLIILRMAEIAASVLPSFLYHAVYRAPGINLFRNVLSLAAPNHLIDVTVAAGLAEGLRLRLDLKKEKYYWLGTYEPMLQRAIRDFVRPGMTVYDVGAHIGYWSLCFSRTVGSVGRVFSFEPLPQNFLRFQMNIGLNGLQSIVCAMALAASDENGVARFQVHTGSSMGKLTGVHGRDSTCLAEIVVSTQRLDAFVYDDYHPPPALIKMDIEGGELKAIPGMECILEEARPICLWELHGPEAIEIALRTLWRHEYDVLRMVKGYPKITSHSELAWKEHIVAVPRLSYQ